MSSTRCQSIRKSDGSQCPNPATYDIDGELVCGVHVGKRKDDKYLIKNKTKNATTAAEVEETVTELRGILLNSAVYPINYRGITFKTVEAAYQAMKFYYLHEDPIVNQLLIEHVYAITKARDMIEVRKLGHSRSLPIRPDWHTRDPSSIYSTRDLFMFDILEQKFAPNTQPACELMATGDRELVDNSNNGKYWCNGSNGHGHNKVGELLLMIRVRLAEEGI